MARFSLNWGKGAHHKVKTLIEAGQVINKPVDCYGYCLLHHAVNVNLNADINTKEESEAITLLLLDLKAAVDVRDSCGRTPLMLAAQAFNVNAVRVLLNGGANVALLCEFGKSALHYTLTNPNPEIVIILIKAGADVNIVDSFGFTFIQDAMLNGNEALVNSILNYQRIVSKRPVSSYRELFWSAFWGRNDRICKLVRMNLNLETQDESENTALIVAVRSGKYDSVRLLLEAGAMVNNGDSIGDTALHWAAKLLLTDIVQIILEYGADPNMGNIFGNNPFEYAIEGLKDTLAGNTRLPSPVIAHLLNYGAVVEYPCCVRSNNLYFKSNIAKITTSGEIRHPNKHYCLYFHKQNKERDNIDFLSSYERQVLCHGLKLRIMGVPSFHCYSSRIIIKQFQTKFLVWNIDVKNNPKYKSVCLQEVALMKSLKIGRYTLHDILVSMCELLDYKMIYKAMQNVNIDKYADKLPIYWGLIEAKLATVSLRRNFFDSSIQFFTFLKPYLPYECVDIIVSYLSFNDMKNLKKIEFILSLNAEEI